jgi:hypothetical protein
MLRRVKTLGLTFALVLGAGGLRLASAQQSQYHGGSLDPRQHGYEHGYRDGFRQGHLDHNQNLRLDYTNKEDYRLADRGYDAYMGDRSEFQSGYRDAYRAGYQDGYYDRPGRMGNIYGYDPNLDPPAPPYVNDRADDIYSARGRGYPDVAFDIGYRDGAQVGQRDRQRNKDFRPDKNDWYEDGNHGYRKGYGDQNSYKAEYRHGFTRGYEDGYGRWR